MNRIVASWLIASGLALVSFLGLAMVVVSNQFQARVIADLMEREVYIYAQPRGPAWLSSRTPPCLLLKRPLQAQVLVQPVDHESCRILGNVMTFPEVKTRLRELSRHLDRHLGIDQFVLVADYSRENGAPESAWAALQLFSLRNKLPVTPCGISNFRAIQRHL
jgi:hypothetical protein